jgi:MFS family permease
VNRVAPVFYGWRIVYAALAIAFISWSFALYGTSVYIHALNQTRGWSIGSLSSILTASFLLNAVLISVVGTLIGRQGPRGVMTAGALSLACGLTIMGWADTLWLVAIGFLLKGTGWACLSTIAISATISPWFEREQGKAISVALLGASLGGMLGVPICLWLFDWLGLSAAFTVIAVIVVLSVIPICWLILRRRPQDMGLHPDGLTPNADVIAPPIQRWTRTEALRTRALRTTIATFSLALMVQIGFLSQQVKLLQALISPAMTAVTVLASGVLAFGARVLLARMADRINIRFAAAVVLWVSAAGLAIAATASSAVWLISGVLIFGLNVGNLTTLPALIVRREFGAASFGKIFGLTGTLMQLSTALGPAAFGLLYDATGGYTLPLAIASGIMIAASFIVASIRQPDRPPLGPNTARH